MSNCFGAGTRHMKALLIDMVTGISLRAASNRTSGKTSRVLQMKLKEHSLTSTCECQSGVIPAYMRW